MRFQRASTMHTQVEVFWLTETQSRSPSTIIEWQQSKSNTKRIKNVGKRQSKQQPRSSKNTTPLKPKLAVFSICPSANPSSRDCQPYRSHRNLDYTKKTLLYNKANDEIANNSLRHQLDAPYEWGTSIHEYLATWTDTVSTLRANGWTLEDRELNFKLVNNLPKEELSIYLEILRFKMSLTTYTIPALVTLLRNDITEKLEEAEITHTANRTTTSIRGKGGSRRGRDGRYNNNRNSHNNQQRDTNNNNKRSRGDDDEPVQCRHCKKLYHTEATCWDKHPELRKKHNKDYDKRQYEFYRKRIKDRQSKPDEKDKSKEKTDKSKDKDKENKPRQSTEVVRHTVRMALVPTDTPDFTEEDAISSSDESTLSQHEVAFHQGPSESYIQSLTDWNIDSACSNHMGCNKAHFDFINPLVQCTWVTVGNGAQVEAKGIGNVTLPQLQKPAFRSKRDNTIHPAKAISVTFTQVLYVPALMANLISCLQMAEKGLSTVILGRRRSQPKDSPLKGAVIDSETQELLFTLTYVGQQYCLDIVTNNDFFFQANSVELSHDDSFCTAIQHTVIQSITDDSSDSNSDSSIQGRRKRSRSTSSSRSIYGRYKRPARPSCSRSSSYLSSSLQIYQSPYVEDTNDEVDLILSDSDKLDEFDDATVLEQTAFTTNVHVCGNASSCPHDHCLETAAYELIWHHRLAHHHPNVLKAVGHMMKFKDAHRLQRPTIHRDQCCAACAQGKGRRRQRSKKTSATCAMDILEMVCVDTIGPITPIASKDGYRYFQLF